jgi:putative secretion ATPase (PEP-CTERM system associated)
MYESHFGLSGPPFQLIPDPSFYFSSRGHSNALAFLKFGAHQGEGFIVVTGEVGAGKTTLVRTLLEGLDPAKVVAAPVVSNQLEAGDLPSAILMAFGVSTVGENKAQLISGLEAFLTDLSSKGRRALLIVDEAQNLAPEVIEELRLLTNFQLGKNAMLQVFLVGQPELRTMLQQKAMDQMRQRVTASCHLGPLDAAETRAYVLHRLQLVGWADKPHFEPEAFTQLHRWTAGIPRRVNRLCNRLLLAAFLESRETITAEGVEQIAQDLRAEIGETDEIPGIDATPVPSFETSTIKPGAVETDAGIGSPDLPEPPEAKPIDLNFQPTGAGALRERGFEPTPLPPAALQLRGVVAAHEVRLGGPVAAAVEQRSQPEPVTPEAAVAPAQTPVPAPAQAVRPARVAAEPPSPAHPEVSLVPAAGRELKTPHAPLSRVAVTQPAAVDPVKPVDAKHVAPLVCLVDSASDYVKARALARILSGFPKLPPVMTVHTGRATKIQLGDGISGVMPGSPLDVHLDVEEGTGAAGAASALFRFDAVLKENAPCAVLVMGASDILLTCSLLAHKSHIPVVRNDAGRRRAWARPGEEMNAVLLERFSDISYISDLATYYTLYRVGIPTDRVLCVGDLSDNVVHFASDHTVQPDEVLRRANIPTAFLKSSRGYAIATTQLEPHPEPNQDAQEMVSRLAVVGKEIPVLWPVNAFTLQELKDSGQEARLEAAHIILVPGLGYLDCIDLLRRARCLIAGTSGEFLDEAVSLGIQSVVLGKGIVVPMKVTEPMQLNVAQSADKLEKLVGDMLAVPPARRPVPEYWDGGPAARIATHLEGWLPKQGRGKNAGKLPRVAKAASAAA